MEIKKFKLFKENHDGGPQNYMFFGNLKTIKRLVTLRPAQMVML